jgi:hypothetical protein
MARRRRRQNKKLFEAVEARFYAYAERVAMQTGVEGADADEPREIRRTNDYGQVISEFVGGNPRFWLNPNGRGRQYVGGFDKK